MSDDTRERARQVAHGLLPRFVDYGCLGELGGDDHCLACDTVTDALVAFANAENEAIEQLTREASAAANGTVTCFAIREVADAIAARRKERK